MHIKPQEYKEVVKLRRQGKSYREIAKVVGVSKSSVSKWCKNLKLPEKARKIIEDKIKHNKSFLISYNKKRHELVQSENKKIMKDAIKDVSSLSNYELLLVGAALYWAEGYKRQFKNPSPSVVFVNSDPKMIELFLRFSREIIKVPEEKIAISVRLYPNINRELTVDFWEKITKIPKEKFHINHQISKSSKGKRSKNSLPYGIVDLRFHSRQNFYKIMGWIDGLTK